MDARPAVPSALLLEAATALDGARATYGALARHLVITGGRDQFHPAAPEDAISPAEALLAEVARAPATPGALDALRGHPWAARVVRLYRAIDRLHRPQAAAPSVDAWSGRVPVDAAPHPADGSAPVAPGVLAEAVANPSEYFFARVLGAWRPRWLAGSDEPSNSWNVTRLAIATLERAVATAPGAPLSALDDALDAVIAEDRAAMGDAASGEVAVARALVADRLATWAERHDPLVPGQLCHFDGDPVAPDVPWRLAGDGSYAGAGEVVAWQGEADRGKLIEAPQRLARLQLEALALTRRGDVVSSVAARAADGSELRDGAPAAYCNAVTRAWRRVSQGLWLVSDGKFALHTERGRTPSDTVALADRLLASETAP